MEEDELDPRIQVELEKLNTATDEINRLEIELDEANTTFRMLLGECTRRLKVHSGKHGSAIVSARPYYEALDAARNAQQECQKAAVGFQRANEIHEAAKETVALAETRFLSQPEWRFDSAWQEMLNHATLKVRDAEKHRAESAAQHGAATTRYKDAQDKVHSLEQRLKRSVAKSRPYFEEKARCNDQLAAQKDVVESLQRCVANTKRGYANSLRRLEGISEEIHRKRAHLLEACPGIREPGVGAELEYRGELDRCDVQSGASNAASVRSDGSAPYDSQSECSSVRSERMEGELVEASAEEADIREAVVVSTLAAAGKPTTSTKQTQQASTSADLTEDFRRAQIGTFSSFEAEHSRYKDYFVAAASKSHLSNAAGGLKLKHSNEFVSDSFAYNKPEGSKLEDVHEYKESEYEDSFVARSSKEGGGSSTEDSKDRGGPRHRDPLRDGVSNAAGDFDHVHEHSNEFKISQKDSSGDSKQDCSKDASSSKQEDPTELEDSKNKHSFSDGVPKNNVSNSSGDSKLSDLKEFKDPKHKDSRESGDSSSGCSNNMKDASDEIRDLRPNEDINKGAIEDVKKGINEDVDDGASIAQDEEKTAKGTLSGVESEEERREDRQEGSETTKTIEREDNNVLGRGKEVAENGAETLRE